MKVSPTSFMSPTIKCTVIRVHDIFCGSFNPNANSESLNNLSEIDQDLWNY